MRKEIEALLRDWKSVACPPQRGLDEHPHNHGIWAAEFAGWKKLQRCIDSLERATSPDYAVARDVLQQRVYAWAVETFGRLNAAPHERCRRFFEEAVELAQAEGLTRGEVLALVDHVYAKPRGSVPQEVGGVGVTLLAYCQSRGVSAETQEAGEFERVLKVDPVEFRARHDRKAEAGVALPSDRDLEVT